MSESALELSVYFGERDHSGGRLLADVLMDTFARRGINTSVLLRGTEGFGLRHRLLSEGSLTLSEDLPLLAVALDAPDRIESLLQDVRAVLANGLITLERARLIGGPRHESSLDDGEREAKLTLYLGRGQRAGGAPAHVAAVQCLHRHGLDGASVLLGLDGTTGGVRRRAGVARSNDDVPLMVVSVGDTRALARALPELTAMFAQPRIKLERVRVCKRDGVALASPDFAAQPANDLAFWQKLVIYSGERSRHGGEPLHVALVRRLRREGAAGASVLRGIWGYHGDHAPHGERFWSLARHVPVLSVLLDTPANMRRWYEIVDELTDETGLVTSELVPALRAGGGELVHGGLALAEPRRPA